ncbi:hypothetical protein SAMN05720759_11339 [Fibrobacter sp. UWB12]|nr:hypothetical protein SAMN05720759_11339 [Fibrobacter sp. UWB12]
MNLVFLWAGIALLWLICICMTKKGRAVIRIFCRSIKVKLIIIAWVLGIAAIATAYATHPEEEPRPTIDEQLEYQKYTTSAIQKLCDQGELIIDMNCNLDSAAAELAYILPTVINNYNLVVTRPTTPILEKIKDTLQIKMIGYKKFKNRGIRLIKALQRDLGIRYELSIMSDSTDHTLIITYNSKPWDSEHLCNLPVLEACLRERTDPAVLMSIIHHTSGFQMNYQGKNNTSGLLALDTGKGLEQIGIGAHRLKTALATSPTLADAIAQFYPDAEHRNRFENWRKDPQKHYWVGQVLTDIQYYRSNGMTLKPRKRERAE